MTATLAAKDPAQRFARVRLCVFEGLQLVFALCDLDAFFGAYRGVVHRCADPAATVEAVAAGVVEWSGGWAGEFVADEAAEAGACTVFGGRGHGYGYMCFRRSVTVYVVR